VIFEVLSTLGMTLAVIATLSYPLVSTLAEVEMKNGSVIAFNASHLGLRHGGCHRRGNRHEFAISADSEFGPLTSQGMHDLMKQVVASVGRLVMCPDS